MIKKQLVIGVFILFLLFSFSYSNSVWNPELTENEGESEFLSDEYFYELGALFDQVKVENNKWYIFDSSKKIAAKAVITKMMEDLESNPNALKNHKNFNRFFDTFDNNIRKLDHISEEMHYFRNTLNSFSNAPTRLDDMITLAACNEWRLFSAKYHRYDFEGLDGTFNVKFISAKGRFEAVYNTETGEIVVDPVNMGTYNYAPGSINPFEYYMHNTFDKIPWKKWGNTEDVSYQEIVRLKSKHGTNEAKKNTKKVERLIQERKSELNNKKS